MVGDFVLVEYEGELFPGKIVKKWMIVQLSVACNYQLHASKWPELEMAKGG